MRTAYNINGSSSRGSADALIFFRSDARSNCRMSSILFAVNMYRPLGHVRFHINCPQLVQRFCRGGGGRGGKSKRGGGGFSRQSRRLPLGLIEQQRSIRESMQSRRASLSLQRFSFGFPFFFSFLDTETLRQQAPHGCNINTTRSDHRNALPPRRRVGPEAASSPRAARACCAGHCPASYILHCLWFPAQAPE